jgi:hypothetical protein
MTFYSPSSAGSSEKKEKNTISDNIYFTEKTCLITSKPISHSACYAMDNF